MFFTWTKALIKKINEGKEALHNAAYDGDYHTVNFLLNSLHEDVNAYNQQQCTPLDLSILKRRPECTILLLEHGADPEILCNNFRGRFRGGKQKIIQSAINANQFSDVIFLIMHGATKKQVHFSKKHLQCKKIFDKTLELKSALDDYLKIAKENYETGITRYQQASLYYYKAATVWHQLGNNEKSVPIYQKYYFEKALELYLKADNCFEKVKNSSAADYNIYKDFLKNISACYQSLNQQNKAKQYADLAASLTFVKHSPIISQYSPSHSQITEKTSLLNNSKTETTHNPTRFTH